MVLVVFLVAVAAAAVPGGADTFLGVAADAELVGLGLVDAKGARRSFVAVGTGVEPHVLGVVEIHVAVVGLEDLGFGEREKHERGKGGINNPFHRADSS